MNTEILQGWTVFDENENDFEVWEKINLKELLFANKVKPKKRNEIDQLSWQCWPTSMFLCISDLFDYEPGKKDFDDLREESKKYWWEDKKWMFFSKAANCVRNFWNNKFPDKKVWFVKINVDSEEFDFALDCGYRLPLGYKISSEHFKDSQDNWKIDNDNFPKNWTWHLVSMASWSYLEIDNYPAKLKYNEYYNKQIKTLVKNGVYSNTTYLFLKENTNTMWEYEKQFYLWVSKWVSNCFNNPEWYVKEYEKAFWKNAREIAFANLIAFNTEPKEYFRKK